VSGLSSGDVRVKHQRPDDVTDRVGDEREGSVDGLLGVAGNVGGAEADALDPTRGEEVDEVVARDAAGVVGRGELPAGEDIVSIPSNRWG
jgi:hypothetical protein